jgi:acyl-CoA reductase-like NAD-dependent aldehyde dehydrogenase
VEVLAYHLGDLDLDAMIHLAFIYVQGCVFTSNINRAMIISDALETGTVQVNSAPARGPDHFPFQVKKNNPHLNESCI